MAIVVDTAGPSAADAQELSLPAIEVSGPRTTAPFRAPESTSATRTGTDVMEIPFALQPDGRTLWRRYRQVAFHSNDVQGRVEVAGKARTAGVGHTFVMGVDAYRFNYDQFVARSTPTAAAPYAIDIFDPVYGQPAPVPRTATNLLERDDGQGLYGQGRTGKCSPRCAGTAFISRSRIA